MRVYVRALLCEACGGVCELSGEHADSWECTFCGKNYVATPEEIERYQLSPTEGQSGDE